MVITTQLESGRKVRSTNADRSATFSTLASLAYAPYLGPWSAATADGATQSRDTGPEVAGSKSGGLLWSGNLMGEAANNIKLWPYLLGSNNQTMLMDVVGWQVVGGALGSTQLWWPTKLYSLTCTAGNFPGLAGEAIIETEFFCDTLVVVDALHGIANVNYQIHTPADDTPGFFTFDAFGFPIIEVRFHRNSSSTSCNALWSRM